MKRAEKSLKNTCKNVALVVLAVLLAVLTVASWDISLAAGGAQPLAGPLSWLQSVWPVGDGGYSQRAGESAAAYPTRIAVTTQEGLMGAAYQEAAVGTLYEAVRTLWAGALSQTGTFAPADESALRVALSGDTMFLEYAGRVPISLLTGWLGGSIPEGDTPSAGALVLTKAGELFVRDPADGTAYRARTSISAAEWERIASTVTATPCVYAGTAVGYDKLRPETLVQGEALAHAIYTSRAPSYWETDSKESLQRLLEAFRYNRDLKSYAEENGKTQVFVGDYSSLRVSQDGTVRYKSTSVSSGLMAYQAEETEGMNAVAAQVEFAQTVLSASLRSIDANNVSCMLRALTYNVQDGSSTLTFSQTLGGVPVADHELARFTFSDGLLTSAELRLRVYEATEEKLYVLPAAQTAAAAPNGVHNYVIAYRVADDGRVLAGAYLE